MNVKIWCCWRCGREYSKIGSTTLFKCLSWFFKGIMQLYEHVYLRAPTQEDLQRILHVSEMRGFPGMIGSIDCMHWEWKNCPTAWEGQFTRGDKGTTPIILEAVASHDLWIWHAFFGCPGTLNDINVLIRRCLMMLNKEILREWTFSSTNVRMTWHTF